MSGPTNRGPFNLQSTFGRFAVSVDPGETTGVAMPEIRPKSLPKLLAQGKHWRRADGTWVRVKDMHPAHRANAARMLLRDAGKYAQQVAVDSLVVLWGAPDEALEEAYQEDIAREAAPEAWMRGTKLYRRLVKGLPEDAEHVHPAGGCVICDDVTRWKRDAQRAQWEDDAIGRGQQSALQAVLTVLDEPTLGVAVLRRNGNGTFTPDDVRALVVAAARRIGVTL